MNARSPALLFRFAGALLIGVLMLAGCGGGDETAAPAAPTPVPPANTPPVAAFTGADSVPAGTPLALDAGTSSDADGDTLTYSWRFGDGRRGGGQQIATLFAAPGSYVVRLTVSDGKGGSASAERNVNVTPGPAAMGRVDALAVVRDASGAPLAGVSVTNPADGSTATTGADGRATIGVDRAVSATLKFAKAGHADQIKAFTLPESAESGYLEVTMTPREPAATLADAAAGGSVTGKDGASVVFEAGSLVNAGGTPVTGPVEVAITPIDIAANVRAFPGRFEGVRSSGRQGLIMSYGTAQFVLSQGGAAVQLAPGRKATIEIPIYATRNRDGSAIKAGDLFPLWSLDERSGRWVEEGSGSVVAAATPSGFALRGEVTHFSWWNHDQFDDPPARPKPKCLVDTNHDGVLEDLTGTGHCWHAGTGPEQPEPFMSLSSRNHRRQALAVEPRTQRIPAWVAEDFTPAAGGKVLPIPADLDITFRSYAKNGTLFGTKVVRMGPNVEEDVPILLEPVKGNPGSLAVSLPYDDRFAVVASGEADRFSFDAEAGASYEVQVSRGTSSLLSGGVRVLNAANTSLAGGGFDANSFVAVVAATAAGTLTVEVTAGGNAPGSYRIEIKKLASTTNCSNPATLAIPSTGNYPISADGALCFDLVLAADDLIEITNSQQLKARGSIRLFAPNGDAVAIDSYGMAPFDAMQLRFGVAQAGTYRLLIVNTQTTAGTINGLAVSRLPLAGTLGLTGSVSFAGPASGPDLFYVVKPGAASHVAIKLVSDNGGQPGAIVWPDGLSFSTSSAGARVVKTHPALLPLVEVFRMNSTLPWHFTLSARVAEPMPLDTDLMLATPAANDVLVYWLDAMAGQQVSIGLSFANNLNIAPVADIYAPLTGQRVDDLVRVRTLAESGTYTVEVRNHSTAGAPFKLRLNSVAPPEPITLTASTERSVYLALGEVRRFSFDVTQAQVLALQLSSANALLDATAVISGGRIHDGFVVLESRFGTSRNSGPRYVQRSEPAVLSLYSPSTHADRSTGQVTLALQAPPPAPTALGSAFSVETPPATLLARGFNIVTAGKHLLCYDYSGPTDSQNFPRVSATVWGPSARFTNYSGDLGTVGLGTVIESIGDLRAGTNTLSLISSLATPTTVNARLVALAPLADLTAGAAPANLSLASCERHYHRITATAGQAFTLRVTAAFAGSVRVRKMPPNGDHTVRSDTSVYTLAGTPLALSPAVERVLSFTIPASAELGTGNYIVEIDADGDASGAYSLSLATP